MLKGKRLAILPPAAIYIILLQLLKRRQYTCCEVPPIDTTRVQSRGILVLLQPSLSIMAEEYMLWSCIGKEKQAV